MITCVYSKDALVARLPASPILESSASYHRVFCLDWSGLCSIRHATANTRNSVQTTRDDPAQQVPRAGQPPASYVRTGEWLTAPEAEPICNIRTIGRRHASGHAVGLSDAYATSHARPTGTFTLAHAEVMRHWTILLGAHRRSCIITVYPWTMPAGEAEGQTVKYASLQVRVQAWTTAVDPCRRKQACLRNDRVFQHASDRRFPYGA